MFPNLQNVNGQGHTFNSFLPIQYYGNLPIIICHVLVPSPTYPFRLKYCFMIPAELTPIFPTWNRTYTRGEAKPPPQQSLSSGKNGPQIYNGSNSLWLSGSVTISVTRFLAVPWTTIPGNLGMF